MFQRVRVIVSTVVVIGLVVAVLAWWGRVEVLNQRVVAAHGEGYIPVTERREDGTPVPHREGFHPGPRREMYRALSYGCLMVPLAYGLLLTTLVQGAVVGRKVRDGGGGVEGGRVVDWRWVGVSGLILAVCVRIWMLSAWEGVMAIYD